MKAIVVEDEELLLNDLLRQLKTKETITEVKGFSSPVDALNYFDINTADIAFLDIQMPEMNGLALAKKIKEVCKEIKIIFITAYSEYAIDAFKIHATGYLMKPITDEAIIEELKNIDLLKMKFEKTIIIKAFGSFEVFSEGTPIHFARSKSKEILAYLVDRRGSRVTKKELAGILWEDDIYNRSRQVQLEILIRDLILSLKSVGADDIIIRLRGAIAIQPELVECDYFKFCAWDMAAINSYNGEYMIQYSWAEFTASSLDNRVHIKR